MKIGHDTLAMLQKKRLAFEQRIKAVERAKAARYIRREAEVAQWTAEDLDQILQMLGVEDGEDSLSTLIGTQWTKR